MADTKHPADVLADRLDRVEVTNRSDAQAVADAADMLRRIPALEAERDALAEKLDQSVHGHNQIFDLCKQMEAERDQLREQLKASEARDAESLRMYRSARDQRDQLRAEVMEQARLLGMSGERELSLRAEIDRLRKDADRLDWLADPENTIGNVQLPRECVEQNLHSLRDAIDEARKLT